MGSKRQRPWCDDLVVYCGCGRPFVLREEEEVECFSCVQRRFLVPNQLWLECMSRMVEDSVISKSRCSTGLLNWEISNFNELSEERNINRVNSLRSQPFYTSQYGYKLCLQLDVCHKVLKNRQDILLRLVILRGLYDATNAWPFKEKVTFQFINQSDPRKVEMLTYQPAPESACFKKPSSEMNVASAGIALPDLQQLHNQGFVKDGTLVLECKCQTSDVPIPLPTQEALPISCEICEDSE